MEALLNLPEKKKITLLLKALMTLYKAEITTDEEGYSHYVYLEMNFDQYITMKCNEI